MRNQLSRSILDPSFLPMYGNRRIWMEALNVSYSTLQAAARSGALVGDRVGIEYYYTKKQILKWYAPSLYKELYGEENHVSQG